ncbi:MAG: DUF2259 domain-containing protein [Hyphomicrobiales bacterium]|nr:DUF2259 domain-containing protein [Hyphomicrobiales bacterium]
MRTALAFMLAFFALSSPVTAGDFAARQILGFSPDGRYFAFEQYGRQDGSGFPYAAIFVIDTTTDSWVKTSPFEVLLRDERAEIKWARREALMKAGNLLREKIISKPGQLLASNPPAEISADPHEISVNAQFAILSGHEPWRFTLKEFPLNTARCEGLFGGPAKGFRLTLAPPKGAAILLHADKSVPTSRGCPMRYALSDIVMHEAADGARVFVALVSVYAFGFEGPDRRFIAVTHRAG